MDHLIIKPTPVPKTGPVSRLKMEIVPDCVDIYLEQTQWPRQKENPKWRIEVTNIDGRYDEETQRKIRDACEQIARSHLTKWLQHVAPLLTIETASWQELVRFATERPSTVLSPYQTRRKRRTTKLKKIYPSGINIPEETVETTDPVEDITLPPNKKEKTQNDK